jgi:hypothetical protein
MYLIKDYFLFLHKMSFHEYYHSLPTTILHEIHSEINKLKNRTDGSGSGGSNHDSKFEDFPDNTTIIIFIEQKLKEFEEISLIRIRNKPYYDEYFVPDFSVKPEERLGIVELQSSIGNVSNNLLLIPYLNNDVINNIIFIRKFWNEGNVDAIKFRKTIQHYGKLIYTNFYESENYGNPMVYYRPVWNQYTLFWIFNNINLTKTYSMEEKMIFLNRIYDELANIINISRTVLTNNQDVYNQFLNLITVSKQTSNSDMSLMDIFETVNNFVQSLEESKRKPFILYLNLCLCAGKEIREDTNDTTTYEMLPDLSTGFNQIMENTYNIITNRIFGYSNPIPEEIIDVFN